MMTILDAITNPKLFLPLFRDLETWSTWIVVLKAVFCLTMTSEELEVYRKLTGRATPPGRQISELWIMKGRRAGFSRMTSFIGVFLGLFYDYSKHLSPGEVGVIQLVAADRQQASVIFGYIRAILHSSPIFEQYITRETAESILLSTRISIEIATASFRSIRGRTCVAFIADELAFWQSEGSSNPDSEIITAIRPSMATIPVSLMICGSTPYGMFGELYETHKRYFGVDNDEILCVQADTRTLNPTISEEFIQKQIERDPAAGRSEWLGLPRDDRELFLSFPMIEACVGHYTERPRLQDQQYHAAGDPSGGRGDSFACAIGHIEDGRLLVDLVREYPPPFDPEAVVREIASILKHYDIEAITTDRYAAAWVSQAFEKA